MKAYRKDGKLIIEIPEENLVYGSNQIPSVIGKQLSIIDREEFLQFCESQILEMGDSGDFNGCSNFTRLLDKLINYAAEMAAGIER